MASIHEAWCVRAGSVVLLLTTLVVAREWLVQRDGGKEVGF